METNSAEDILKTFASDEVLSDFLNDEFQVQDYATKVIQNAAISKQLAQLFDGISMLDKELQSQISSRHEDLLAQATGIESLEGILSMMQTRINSLQSAVDRIRSKVGEPFSKIQARTIQLGRMQATCDLLRRIIRIQRLSKRLHVQLQGGVRELTKAAQSLSELDYLSAGIDLNGIEVLESDRAFIQRAKEEVNAQASRLLDQGTVSLNQAHTATALQVFYNLGSLHIPIEKARLDAEKNARQNIKTALDTRAILKRSGSAQTGKGPGKATGLPAPGNMSLFRANLWNNMEVLTDHLASITNQMIHLHKVLSKKRDPLTHVKFLDELAKRGPKDNNVVFTTTLIAQSGSNPLPGQVVASLDKTLCDDYLCLEASNKQQINGQEFLEIRKNIESLETPKQCGNIYFVKKFWETLTKDLEKEMTNSTQASSYVKQAFEGEYPKLLRLFNDLWAKLDANQDVIRGSIATLKEDTTSHILPKETSEDESSYNPKQALKSSIQMFETAYLQRSISRLFDPINLVFPQGGRNPPSQDELEAICKTISSEMVVACVDSSLEVTVARNIAKTIQLFAVKSEQLISTQGEASQVIGAPTAAQTRNVAVVNSLYNLQTNVLKVIDDQQMLSHEAIENIRSACENLSYLMASAVAPLVDSVADSIEAIILTIHNENFEHELEGSGEATLCSLYMKELRDFLARVVHDHFKLFQCQNFVTESLLPLGHRAIDLFVRHACLIRPIGEGGKMKLAADFAQMELAISPLCRRLTDLGPSYRLLRSFRPLLFQTEDSICESSSVGDVIPCSTALHFFFSRAPPEVRSPHQVMGWSLAKYSKWLDEHRSERERLNMLRGTIENYVSSVRARQKTEFAPVYPYMVKLLQKGMEKQTASS